MTGPDNTVAGFAEPALGDIEPRWLTRDEVIALHEKQLARFGGPSGIRDVGMLESALDRPRNKWAYEGADVLQLGSAYAFGIARNHPFIDGNKRAAFVAMMLFLRLNGVLFRPSQPEATQAMLKLAAGEIAEDGFTRWIRDRLSGV
jgi:death-on-curing protein